MDMGMYIFYFLSKKTNMQKTINSVEEMIKLGYELATEYNFDKVLLHGNLWAGKTHFTKWWTEWILAKTNKACPPNGGSDEVPEGWNAYDINSPTYNVNSPTYVYYHTYGDILHLDMYRLAEYSDLVEKGILDQILEHDYVAIERPRHESAYIDNKFHKIEINKIDENTRIVKIDE